MQINLLSRPTFSYLCEDVAAGTRCAIAAGRRATRRRVRFAVRRRRSKLAEHERILADLTGIQASGAQTPVDAPERGGQRRGVAHAHLGRAYLRSVTGFRPAALHPDSLAGGLHPRAGIPAGLRGQPLARNAAAKHHAARLDRTADDPDAYLQRQHRPHHGGQDARGTQRRQSRQHQGRQDAGDALARGFAPAHPDGGRRPLRTGKIAVAQDAARSDGHDRAGRRHHHRKVRHQTGAVRHPDRRGTRIAGIGRRQRHGRAEPVEPRRGLRGAGAARRQRTLDLQKSRAVDGLERLRSGEVLGYSNDPQAEGTDSKLFGFELWSDGKPVDPEGYIVF